MSEVVDSDEELMSNYHQPNLNMQTHQSGNEESHYLFPNGPGKDENEAMSITHSKNPSISQNEAAYVSVVHDKSNEQEQKSNFLTIPLTTPTVANIKGQANDSSGFQRFKQSTGSYVVLQAANTESQIEQYEE